MIVSVSRRTDIPAFYMDWFMNRVRAGYALTRNPINYSQIRRVSLLPSDVDCLVFWTKDPRGLIPCLSELDARGFASYIQFTMTPYGPEIEPGLRDKEALVDAFIRLGELANRERLVWRYDPILLWRGIDESYHAAAFEKLCRRLHPYTDTVVISFVDEYAKARHPAVRTVPKEIQFSLARRFAQIGSAYGLAVTTCCEALDLRSYGVGPACCVDKNRIEGLLGRPLAVKPEKSQRPGCHCAASVDIGAYNTCPHGCVYCYANHSQRSVAENCQRHRPDGEFLLGEKT